VGGQATGVGVGGSRRGPLGPRNACTVPHPETCGWRGTHKTFFTATHSLHPKLHPDCDTCIVIVIHCWNTNISLVCRDGVGLNWKHLINEVFNIYVIRCSTPLHPLSSTCGWKQFGSRVNKASDLDWSTGQIFPEYKRFCQMCVMYCDKKKWKDKFYALTWTENTCCLQYLLTLLKEKRHSLRLPRMDCMWSSYAEVFTENAHTQRTHKHKQKLNCHNLQFICTKNGVKQNGKKFSILSFFNFNCFNPLFLSSVNLFLGTNFHRANHSSQHFVRWLHRVYCN
jgi:hypothetical protein